MSENNDKLVKRLVGDAADVHPVEEVQVVREFDPEADEDAIIGVDNGYLNTSFICSGTILEDHLSSSLMDLINMEVDPVVGLVSGVVVSDGAGNIEAGIPGVDFEEAGAVAEHETDYNHDDYDTAFSWGDHDGLYDPIGTGEAEALSGVAQHETNFDHTLLGILVDADNPSDRYEFFMSGTDPGFRLII